MQFETLPLRVRDLHDVIAKRSWTGRTDVTRGNSLPCRAAATLFGLPPAGDQQPIRVTFQPVAGKEIWTREFGSAVFRSVQSQDGRLLSEQVGPTSLIFALVPSQQGLALKLRSLRFLGIPLPRMLHPIVSTFEGEREGRYHFEVEATMPLFGLLVRYSGWLARENTAAD
jgi:hypothetical protein